MLYLLRAAAILILPLLASWLTYTFIKRDAPVVDKVLSAVLQVPNGQMVSMVLPDSTLVWVNSASTLTYHNNFGTTDRTVELSGEAYFEVAKNKDLPFLVKTSEFDIKVTGTSFNVKAYPGDKLNTVTLISGSIDLITLGETYSLQANQQLVYNKSEKNVVSRDIPKAEFFSHWTNNSMRYENERMEHVGMDIERLFNVKVTYSNEKIKNYLFTGTIKNVNLVDFLETICLVAPFRYEISKGNILLHEEPIRIEYYTDVE
ncbi:FecR family protein [Parabacteroides sp. OttesenSCG-928-K15]|nr:FecR family protein [Parabacteroides sp. OttesenSCG-928-K15]